MGAGFPVYSVPIRFKPRSRLFILIRLLPRLQTGLTEIPPMDMFWGDRISTLVDPEGNRWMLATHKSEPTPEQMQADMKKQFANMNG